MRFNYLGNKPVGVLQGLRFQYLGQHTKATKVLLAMYLVLIYLSPHYSTKCPAQLTFLTNETN